MSRDGARKLAKVLARSSGLFRALRFALNGRFAPCICRRIQPHLAAPVLDIGCGTGELAHFIRIPYVGIDTDRVFLPAARRQVRSGAVLAADGTRLPFRAGVFGSALLIQTLHHLSDDLALEILAESARCARRVIVVDAIDPKGGPLRRWLHDVDRGKNMRTLQQQEALIGKALRVDSVSRFWGPTRMYEFSLFVCQT